MNYTIREKNGAFWVIDTATDEPIKSGPYANEASAKRRIRALKQKDAENTTSAAPDCDNDHCATQPDQGSMYELAREQPPVNPPPVFGPGFYGTTSAGVYPAVGKNEYRRRWNV